MKRVLLIEDDPLISRTLRLGLAYRGFEVISEATAAGGLRAFDHGRFDLVVIDVGLPDATGYEVCRRLRGQAPSLPILMLTARLDESSAVGGFDSGADDYLRKPCGLDEMTSRMNRLLGARPPNTDRREFGSLSLSVGQRRVWVGSVLVPLGRKEFDLLAALLKRPGEVLRREAALELLSQDGELYDRTIDSHISHLRRKLKAAGLEGVRIAAVYGMGYRMEEK